MTEDSRPPGSDPAHLLQRAIELHRNNRLSEASLLYHEVLASQPNHADALYLLGVFEGQRGRHDLAADLIGRAAGINPENPKIHYNLGNALRELNRFEEALRSYDNVLRLRADDPATLNNRGGVLSALKRPLDALSSYDRAIALQPDHFEAHNNRGNTLLELGRDDEALASFNKALELRPRQAGALVGRGKALVGLDRFEDALSAFGQAISVRPNYVEAYLARSKLLLRLGHWDRGVREHEIAIEVSPEPALLHQKLGDSLSFMGRYKDAFDSYERAFLVDPELAYLEGLRFLGKMYLCDWSNLSKEREHLLSRLRQGKPVATPFALLNADVSPHDQLKCAQGYASAKYPPDPLPLWRGETYEHKKIRLGYVSGEFRSQATSFLTAGIFESHDRNTFEVHAISTGSGDESPMRRRLVSGFDAFHDVFARKDREIAELIRRLEIDVLVNLNGYFGDERTTVFALKPSPVQVNYLGFPGTMGTPYMDYILADRWTIPEGQQPNYSEKVVYLPESYQANDDKRIMVDPAPSRVECGLPESGFVFCCFNMAYKITPEIFDIWMRLLANVPASVLWLLEVSPLSKENLWKEAEARGVELHRIVFAPIVEPDAHLSRGRLADLFLDTLPVNAHTTASDSLWMGVPVITCLGSTFAGRVAASLLSAIGLEELITNSLDEYEALALKLARDAGGLRSIKEKLARNRARYPLFDTSRFTAHLEAAYRHMWERHQHGLAPAGFSVATIESSTS